MTGIHRLSLALALVLTPVLMSITEFLRQGVEGNGQETDSAVADAAAQLAAVAEHQTLWRLHGGLEVVEAVVYLIALVGLLAVVVGRPVLALVTGAVGVAHAVLTATHIGFYPIMIDTLASTPDTLRRPAAEILAGDVSPLGLGVIAAFMLASVVAPLVFATAVWKAGAAPARLTYSGALLWIVGDLVGGGTAVGALAALGLLLVFAPAARALLAHTADRSAGAKDDVVRAELPG